MFGFAFVLKGILYFLPSAFLSRVSTVPVCEQERFCKDFPLKVCVHTMRYKLLLCKMDGDIFWSMCSLCLQFRVSDT